MHVCWYRWCGCSLRRGTIDGLLILWSLVVVLVLGTLPGTATGTLVSFPTLAGITRLSTTAGAAGGGTLAPLG